MDAGTGVKIGVIGGAGWLGGALAGALLDAGIVSRQDLTLSYRSERPDRFDGALWTKDNQALADRSDVILLSVRPADWSRLSVDANGKLLISVMAGIQIESLRDRHRTERVVRCLPNAAVEVSRSYTPWVAAEAVGDNDRAYIRSLLSSCGAEDEVHSESDIDYFTGFSGAGPAFPALLAEAMAKDAVSRGIPAAIAERSVAALLIGAGRLLEKHGEPAAETVRAFIDYRGTTAAAIETMREAGFDAAIAAGLAAALKKSVSLGEASRQL